MPNIKSQIKRDRQNLKRNEKNRALKGRIKKLNNKLEKLIEEKDIDQAQKILNDYFKALDKAAKVKTVHKNFVANKKSRASKRFNSIKTAPSKEKKDAKSS